MESYKFSVPSKVSYVVDESTISIESVDDLLDLQEVYDVNLDNIIDECECAMESETDLMYDEEDEYFGRSEEDKFNDIITDNWKDIMKCLNRECKFDDVDDEELTRIFEVTKESLEKTITVDVFDCPKDKNFEVSSITLESFNRLKSEFIINFDVTEKLKKDDIEYIRGWLESELYEKWGEKYSKFDLSEKIGKDDVYVYAYLIPWSQNKDIKYVKL
jgi:hypothetical protein